MLDGLSPPCPSLSVSSAGWILVPAFDVSRKEEKKIYYFSIE